MPNRIIRESALTSHSLNRLSDGAERLFWRLTLVADDHGRFDAYPPTVKARCFPCKVDELKTDKIRAWLVELSRDHCLYYTVGDRIYGQFYKWAEYQRQYGHASKFPQPPADCGSSPQNPALTLNRDLESRIDTYTVPPAVAPANGHSRSPSREDQLEALDDFAISDELKQWAKEKYGVDIPDHVLEEFKDHWRSQKKLRTDWEATFKMNITKLVNWNVLKPSKEDVWS